MDQQEMGEMKSSVKSDIQDKEWKSPGVLSPGVWSTDDYIRRWALRRGMAKGKCVIPLQSLHDEWIAQIDFDRKGHPVERIATTKPSRLSTSAAPA